MEDNGPMFARKFIVLFAFLIPGTITLAQPATKRVPRPNPSSTVRVSGQRYDENEVRQVIAKLKASGQDWSPDEENYVVENINRSQLITTIERWKTRKKTLLPREVEIDILIDYLLTELTTVKALGPYLDELGTSKSRTNFAGKLKTQVSATNFTEYAFGRLQIDSNVEPVDLFLDSQFAGNITRNKNVLVLLEGGHTAIVKRSGSSDCPDTFSIVAGQTYVMKCTFGAH
jgi:hypothetical protein